MVSLGGLETLVTWNLEYYPFVELCTWFSAIARRQYVKFTFGKLIMFFIRINNNNSYMMCTYCDSYCYKRCLFTVQKLPKLSEF